jgi:hypothetical protein
MHSSTMPSFNVMKKMETRRLHNTDMKKLVNVLRGVSPAIKPAIKALPYRLRHSPLSIFGTLCPLHKGLNHHLIIDIQSWVTHEFDGAIGRYIYPVIMGGKLTPAQQSQIRHLEPVLRMWRAEFKTESSAPPGRAPIQAGEKWDYQCDRCSACVLARIGADEDVLHALYAGMIARFHTSKLVSGKDLGVATLNHPKSKRVRFVRYWIKACRRGDALLCEAADLGLVIKKLHREWKDARRTKGASIYNGRVSLGGTTVGDEWKEDDGIDTANPRSITMNPFRDSTPSTQIVSPTSDWSRRSNSKLGPRPRPSNMPAHSPLSHLGFGVSRRPGGSDTSTLGPNDSVSVAMPPPLRIKKSVSERDAVIGNYPLRRDSLGGDVKGVEGLTSRGFARHSSRDGDESSGHQRRKSTSLASTVTISSYDGGRTRRPQDHSRLSAHAGIPVLQRQSMYYGYGDMEQVDPFEGVDEEVGDEEEEDGGAGVRRHPSVETSWEELYWGES